MKIPFCKVECGKEEEEKVLECLRSGWLTSAKFAVELEQSFAQLVGAKHAFAVNSCTSALHLALDAVAAGEQVFVPNMTFTATAEVVRYIGAEPIPLDVDYGTSSLTPAILKEAIRQHPTVKTLIAVHYGGQALDMGPGGILDVCNEHGITLIEDAAHALPTRFDNQYVGTFGKVTCFSFYANKTMTTGEGGMVTTDDDEVAARVKLMRLHGINRDVWDRFTNKDAKWEYDVMAPGFKYNMPDLNAAVGVAQLKKLQSMRDGRQRVAELYFELLGENPLLDLPVIRKDFADHAFHLFTVKLSPDAAISRDQLIVKLNNAGIGTSVHYKPIHRLTYYREMYGLEAKDFPTSELLWQRTVSLPIFHLLTEDEVRYICTTLNTLTNNA